MTSEAVSCGGGVESLYSFASGEKIVSSSDTPVCVRGEIVVTFVGDPAAGCQAHGLCSFSGTETWNPAGEGDLGIFTFGEHGQHSTSATLTAGGFDSPVTSVVQQVIPGAAATTCRDRAESDGGFFDLSVQNGDVDVGLDHGEEATFGTRCAGPVDSDFASALPGQSVSLARLRHGQMTIDLSGSAPFEGEGFSGTVTSTVTLALGRPHVQSGSQGTPAPSTGVGTRFTTVEYRISQLDGATSATVKAPSGAVGCRELDACGRTGTIVVTPRLGSAGSAYLTASSSTRRPPRDVLTALGIQTGGRTTGISVEGAGALTSGGTVAETLSADPVACADRVTFQQNVILVRQQAGRLVVSLSPGASAAADPLRTRCPGPTLGTHQLASVALPLSTLRRPRFTVHLHGGTYTNGPYTVTTHSTLSVTLQRGRVRTEVLPSLG